MNFKSNALWMAAALMAVLPLLAACGGKEPQPQPNQIVSVKIAENQIQMPASVAPGKTTFKLTNNDTRPHSFEIDGPAGENGLKSALQPGQSTTLEVDLWPGTYRVYCPQDVGMTLALQVSEMAHS
jgi:plastocyanin